MKGEEFNQEEWWNEEYQPVTPDIGLIKTTDGVKLAYIGNLNNSQKGLNFLTANEDFIQVATFKYEKGHIMRAHKHIDRTPPETFRTEEVLLVWKGRVVAMIYGKDKELGERCVKRILSAGDYVIVFNGGIQYKVLEEDTIMLEAKTGPFTTSEEDRILL